ncbi:MAG: hypothetical protein AB7G93_02320 [Bdellovibrionales bacterium]
MLYTYYLVLSIMLAVTSSLGATNVNCGNVLRLDDFRLQRQQQDLQQTRSHIESIRSDPRYHGALFAVMNLCRDPAFPITHHQRNLIERMGFLTKGGTIKESYCIVLEEESAHLEAAYNAAIEKWIMGLRQTSPHVQDPHPLGRFKTEELDRKFQP